MWRYLLNTKPFALSVFCAFILTDYLLYKTYINYKFFSEHVRRRHSEVYCVRSGRVSKLV